MLYTGSPSRCALKRKLPSSYRRSTTIVFELLADAFGATAAATIAD